MAEWYVFHNGTESGPFSDDAFLEFVRDKNPATVQIWREGLAGWVLAKTIPTLAAAMKPAVPAPVTKPKSGPKSAPQSGFKSEPKAGAIPWPSVTAHDRAVTDNGAAPSDRLESVAVSVDDRFPDAGADDAAANTSKWNWAQYGALIGVLLGLLDLVFRQHGSIPAKGNIGGIFYFLGYAAASAAPVALLGFLAGALRDYQRKIATPKEMAEAEIDANELR